MNSKPRPKLAERVIRRLFGSYIDSQVTAQVEERLSRQAVSYGSDPDAGDGFRSIATTRRDLTPVDQDKLINIASYLANANPLASRIRKLNRDFVIGDGITIEADDKETIQPIIDQFWKDPLNNFDEFQFDVVDYLSIYGELILPTFVNPFNGKTVVGWVDPVEVDRVLPDATNRRIMRRVLMKYGASAGASDLVTVESKRLVYDIANVVTDPNDKAYGYRKGNVLHFKINCAPDARRGRSDYESLIDYLDILDQSMWNDLERVQMLLKFVWDVTVDKATPEDVEKFVKAAKLDKEPPPGAVRYHNKAVEFKAVTPELRTQETCKLADSTRKFVIGAAGFSDFFIGYTEGANRASSDNLDKPILQSLQSRQRKVRAMFRELIDYAIDQRALSAAGRSLKLGLETGRISRNFTISMPELHVKDLSKVGNMIAQLGSALDLAVEKGWLSNETAQTVFVSLLPQFGLEQVKIDEELKRIEAETADREAAETEKAKAKEKSLADKLDGEESDDEMVA
ncbi:MAG TPA: hypothetical protein VF747_06620 [Blastocatellia bacterium]